MTETVQSADGTPIAYDVVGSGPAVVIVGGALSARHGGDGLASHLADRYTVYTYDRRGRGDSGDTPPYVAEREIDDIRAVIDAAGGSALLYGHSSGAMLALEAAERGVGVTKVVAYEPPYVMADDEHPDNREQLHAAVAEGDRERAAELFFEHTGASTEDIAGIKASPVWEAILSVALTAPYDTAIAGDGSIPTERLSRIAVPVLLLDGGESPAWAAAATTALEQTIPDARRLTVEGQTHSAAEEVIVPLIVEFFG